MPPRRHHFGPFVLDTGECALTRDGAPVPTQPKVFEVLRFFVERPGRLVTRDELLKGVWQGVYVSDQALTQMLHKARVALGDDVDTPRYLATVQRRGYRFVAPVHAEEPPVDEPTGPAPPPADDLHGREADVDALRRRLAAGERLLTLVGPPGVGKSRLARAVLAGLPARRVALGDTADADELTARLDADPGGPGVLLVDDADAALDLLAARVPRLLEATPGLAVVVTSREALRLEREQVWPVRPLPTGPDGPAVALFLARARAVLPDLAPSPDERAAIVALVDALDGLPLAIELAATKVRTMPPSALVARLDRRFEWLRSARRDAPPRHASLRACLDAAWATLPPWEQATLAQLAALPSPWTLEDAEAVVRLEEWPDAPDVVASVDALFGKSLVGRAGAGPGSPYRLLSSLRLYARARLEEPGAVAGPWASWSGPERARWVEERVKRHQEAAGR